MNSIARLAIMLLATSPGFAQPLPPTPNAAPPADPHVTNGISQMHLILKITPEQEPAWSAFAKIMQDNATATYDAFQHRGETITSMSSVANLKNLAQIELARAQGLQNLAYSYETLYGTFSGEQKKLADDMFQRHRERAQGRHHPPKKSH